MIKLYKMTQINKVDTQNSNYFSSLTLTNYSENGSTVITKNHYTQEIYIEITKQLKSLNGEIISFSLYGNNLIIEFNEYEKNKKLRTHLFFLNLFEEDFIKLNTWSKKIFENNLNYQSTGEFKTPNLEYKCRIEL